MDVSQSLGVYVSVPFCRAKCSFCNFASGVGKAGEIEAYVARLCAEIEGSRASAERLGAMLPRAVDTVYFGGGTPSLLAPAQLQQIFAALRRSFDVAADAEITLEAAPGQIAEDMLAAAMALGVNRISLGVQSFVDRECAAVGRLHTGEECLREILRLRAAGVAEAGADLIAGLPYQTAESWEQSLDAAVSLADEGALTHLSVYLLEIDKDSRLGQEVMAGGQRFHAHGVPQEELAVELYERACERLPAAGMEQYEISNFARPGSRSRHNVKYWQREPYAGFGLDAHSMLTTDTGAVRFANAEELAGYMGRSGAAGLSNAASLREASGRDDTSLVVTRVGEREAFEETLFLGLRMCEGVAAGWLRAEFRREWVEPFEDTARELVTEGLMLADDGCWRLTQRGRLVSNDVFGAFLDVVPA